LSPIAIHSLCSRRYIRSIETHATLLHSLFGLIFPGEALLFLVMLVRLVIGPMYQFVIAAFYPGIMVLGVVGFAGTSQILVLLYWYLNFLLPGLIVGFAFAATCTSWFACVV
jgi:hypothetical protein